MRLNATAVEFALAIAVAACALTLGAVDVFPEPELRLPKMAAAPKVDGVIDCSLKFCCLYDTEKYSVSRALKEAGVPILSLETDYTDTDAEQLRTRIGAFVEMLDA